MPPYSENLNWVLTEIREMLVAKHVDYGTDNLKKHGQLGIVVRLDDKMARLNSLLSKEAAGEETVRDTYRDIAGYAIQALLMIDEKI